MRQDDPPDQGVRLELGVFVGDVVAVYPLPERGDVTLGRAKENDVPIDDASVSRQHAVLHLGPPMEIEDLGSANGTVVRAPREASGTTETHSLKRQPGETMAVEVGASINLGSALVVIRRAGAALIAAEASAPKATAAPGGGKFVVRDPAMQALYEQATLAASGTISVLVLGETGVGKEVLARAIHERSPRAAGPFLPINCAALSESLLESELFGHEKGAFTGALTAKPGLFEVANGGTVFLDEVGELGPSIQVKLLRVLEERSVMRVGGRTPRPIDVRFISATNRDIDAEIQRGAFRQDVFFRLNGITFTVPPLRERVVEIPKLTQLFLANAAHQLGRAREPALSREAEEALARYAWPGNVRELKNAIEHAVALCPEDTLSLEHLPRRIVTGKAMGAAPAGVAAGGTLPPDQRWGVAQQAGLSPHTPEPRGVESVEQLRMAMDALERQRIIEALERCAGNQTKAAELLGISRRTLVTKLGSYNLPRPRKGS